MTQAFKPSLSNFLRGDVTLPTNEVELREILAWIKVQVDALQDKPRSAKDLYHLIDELQGAVALLWDIADELRRDEFAATRRGEE